MPDPTLLSHLVLEIADTAYEAQLSNAQIQPSYEDNSVRTFSGDYSTTAESFVLHLEGFQDWAAVDGFCDLMWTAVDTPETPLAFTLTINGKAWTGNVLARRPPAGGAAGDPFSFTLDLPVQGKPAYAAATPAP